MKNNILKFAAILLLSGLLASCAEEEINPSDDLNAQRKHSGVTQDDKKF